MAKRGRKKQELVSEEFKNVVASSDTNELKEKVCTLSKHQMDTLKAKKEDQALVDAQELAKELSAPYRDALKTLRAQLGYVLKTLEERGVSTKP